MSARAFQGAAKWTTMDEPCASCGKPYRIINRKYSLCVICNQKRLHPNQKLKYYQKKRRKNRGESDFFAKIWLERPHICVNCKSGLGDEPRAHHFAHIIPKGREESGRLDPDNVRLFCRDCHYAYDFQGKEKFEARKKV